VFLPLVLCRGNKLLFLVFLLFTLSFKTSFAQQTVGQPWWYTLERGKLYFRDGSYGDALIAFEDARRSRIAQFTRMEQDFILLLSVPQVRSLGDSLEFVERYIADRRESAAAAALAELYYRIPKDSLKNSATKALEELDRLKNYPEAEYWLGETYKAEGELGLALRQYEKALKEQTLLESPGFDADILYRITDIHRVRRNYLEMEKRAKEIIEGPGPAGLPRDSLWTGSFPNQGESGNQIRAAMARILENEGINRFLTLYRYNNTVTEKAHRLLGFYYYSTSRYIPAAEHLMFSFLIQNTILIDQVIRRDYDFTFTSLDDLMSFVNSRPELLAFVDESEYYKTVFYLSSALFVTGKAKPSRELWAFLAGNRNAGVWGERARRSPSPFVERAIEMP
jgi:tetratricopeptide (TPR) repeat protein